MSSLKARAQLARELALALDRAADLEAKLTAGAEAEVEKPTPAAEPAPKRKRKPKPKARPTKPSPRGRRELGGEDRQLLESLVAQEGSQRKASKALGLDPPSVNRFLCGARRFLPEHAKRCRELLRRPE